MKLVAVNFPEEAKKRRVVNVAMVGDDGNIDICVCNEDHNHWQPILTLTKEGKVKLLEFTDYYGFITSSDKICIE